MNTDPLSKPLPSTGFGLMFHHFHDAARHPKGQGALSSDEFTIILESYGEVILSAHDWASRLLDGTLEPGKACLTFDDGLRCQFDVALPVLEARSLTAFWFPYTAPFSGELDRLEIYRYFRTVCFSDIDAFYEAFDAAWGAKSWSTTVIAELGSFDPGKYLSEYSFYTDGDRRFRYIRDRILGQNRYFEVMDGMIDTSEFDCSAAARNLWMGEDELKYLQQSGHVIGLHSHTHPTNLTDLAFERQEWEFDANAAWLKQALDMEPDCVSYPCGSYDERLIELLSGRGVRIGFQSRMGPHGNHMTMPRLDHTVALAQLTHAKTQKMNRL